VCPWTRSRYSNYYFSSHEV